MRILIVGSTGLLGSALVKTLTSRGHEVLQASRTSDFRVDIADPASIAELYGATGPVDAVACAAGSAPMAPLTELSYEDFQSGFSNKLSGQVELVRQGIKVVADGGSFTLVSGITAYDPIRNGAVLSAVNGALDGFVCGAAVEMPRGLRINSVSATIFSEAVGQYGDDFPGFASASTSDVARAFVKSIEGVQTGQTYRVGF